LLILISLICKLSELEKWACSLNSRLVAEYFNNVSMGRQKAIDLWSLAMENGTQTGLTIKT
jgi:hypothetical protein